MPRKWLSVSEAAEHLRVHPDTIRALIKAGRVSAVRFGRSIRIDAAQLDASGVAVGEASPV